MGDLNNAPLTRFITNFVRTGLPSNIQLRSKIATARPHSVEEYFSLLYNKGIVGEHARSSYVIGRRFSLRIGTRGLLARLVQSAEIERYLVAVVANWDSSGVGTGMRKFAAGGRSNGRARRGGRARADSTRKNGNALCTTASERRERMALC